MSFRVFASMKFTSVSAIAVSAFLSSFMLSSRIAPSPSRTCPPRKRHFRPCLHSPVRSNMGHLVEKSTDGCFSLIISSSTSGRTNGGLFVRSSEVGKCTSRGFAARYADVSCVNRHLQIRMQTDSQSERLRRRTGCHGTHSAPNSQALPVATFQHSSTSSRTFWNRRPLFAPRLFFRSSLASALRCAPESLFPPSGSGSASSLRPFAWVVLPSAASSSGKSRGANDTRNLC